MHCGREPCAGVQAQDRRLFQGPGKRPAAYAAPGFAERRRPLADRRARLPAKGRTAMISPDKGNCLACHRVAALSGEPNHGDLGPTLNGVGLRYSEASFASS